MLQDIDYVVNKLDWMRHRRIWPNGLSYLWTDAFGLVGDLKCKRGSDGNVFLELRKIYLVVSIGRGVVIFHVIGFFLIGHKGGHAFEQKIEIIGANEGVSSDLIGIPLLEWR